MMPVVDDQNLPEGVVCAEERKMIDLMMTPSGGFFFSPPHGHTREVIMTGGNETLCNTEPKTSTNEERSSFSCQTRTRLAANRPASKILRA
eukprot:scaffold1334_cov123-Cylindrotheca_fusiformis.AAC.3